MGKYKDKLQLEIGAKDTGASRIIGGIKRHLIGIAGAVAGIMAAKKAITAVVNAAKLSEKTWNDVAASLQRHDFAVGTNLKTVKNFAAEMQTLTGVSDEVFGESVQILLDYNNDMKTSFDLVKVAADLAKGGHMDMKAAVDLVGKASVGYTGTLSRYGIIIDESIPKAEKFAEAIRQINQRFGGAAQAHMKTYAGQVELLEQTWGDLKETIGFALLPVLRELAMLMTDLIKIAIGETGNLKDSLSDLTSVIHGIRAGIEPAIKYMAGGFAVVRSVILGVVEALNILYTPLLNTIGAVKALISGDLEIAAAIMAGTFDNIAASIEEITNQTYNFKIALMEMGLAAMDFNTLYTQAVIQTIADTGSQTIGEATQQVDEFLAHNQMRTNQLITASKNYYRSAMTSMVAGTKQSQSEISKVWRSTLETSKASARIAQAAFQSISQAGSTMINQLVDQLFQGRLQIKDIFKQMAADFIKYFVSQALGSMGGFVGGIIGIIGSIFDTRSNDLIAMTQGKHVIQFMVEGMRWELARANLGQLIVQSMTAGMPRGYPGMATAGVPMYSPPGPSLYERTKRGEVDFSPSINQRAIERGIEKHAYQGFSRVALQDEFETQEK